MFDTGSKSFDMKPLSIWKSKATTKRQEVAPGKEVPCSKLALLTGSKILTSVFLRNESVFTEQLRYRKGSLEVKKP